MPKSSSASGVRDRSVPEEIACGLKNYWYPVFPSADLGRDNPVSIKRLGEDLVLWRDADGVPRLFSDRCPHRGAPLSLGEINEKGRLQCWYHGLEYDGTGQCRNVPYDRREDGPLACAIKAQSYPTEEHHDFVWGYIGDVEKFPPPPLTMEPEVESEDHLVVPWVEKEIWNGAWPLVIDNVLDVNHAAFLHQVSASAFAPPEELLDYFVPTDVTTEVTEGDIRVGGRAGIQIQAVSKRKNGDPDLESFVMPTTMNLTVPTFNGKRMIIVGYMVPVDEHRTQFYQHTCFKIDEDVSRDEWEAIYPKIVPVITAIYAEDRAIIESQGAVEQARASESLLPHDRLLMQVRRLYLKALKAQQ